MTTIFFFSASTNNTSKESLPVESPNTNNIRKSSILKLRVTSKKPRAHDDFRDLLDYSMLDSGEREKHRVRVERIHPVVEKSEEGGLTKINNPTIADLKNVDMR